MINYAHSSSLSSFVFYLSFSQSETEKAKSVPIHGSTRGLCLNTCLCRGGHRGASLHQGFFPKTGCSCEQLGLPPGPTGKRSWYFMVINLPLLSSQRCCATRAVICYL